MNGQEHLGTPKNVRTRTQKYLGTNNRKRSRSCFKSERITGKILRLLLGSTVNILEMLEINFYKSWNSFECHHNSVKNYFLYFCYTMSNENSYDIVVWNFDQLEDCWYVDQAPFRNLYTQNSSLAQKNFKWANLKKK